MNRKSSLSAALAVSLSAALITFVPPALAQPSFPSKPIRVIVPFSAGGGGDAIARRIAARLGERTGVSVVVDNRAGASGNIGAEVVVRSAPDGYTLLSASSTYGIQAAVGKPPFDPVADVTPIITLSRAHPIIIVNPSSPYRSLRDLIEAAKRQPDTLTYGTSGVGAIAHMTFEAMSSLAGIRMRHVPYKGSSQALADVLGGSIDVTSSNPVVSTPLIRAGRLRGLVTGGASRYPALPDVPTFAEAGLPGFEPYDWKAWLGPKGIPPEVVARLNSEINAILKEKDFAAVLEADGSMPVGGTPAQLLALIKSDVERWRALVRDRQIRLE
jgi:tripartite-type tricarboxylate transporter receptor subunit TctC